ncbi:MAG TPA: hypothetical protein VGO61_06955 [Steroidobacteraceae bacterium]|nr:hypothetical protein [Steroidobacteraceae bacterium]
MSGSLLSFVGASLAVLGALISAFGAYRSSDDNRKRSDELAAKSEEIANLNREIADISKNLVGYVTGAESYVYFHIFRFGLPTMDIRLVHKGKNPIRDTEIAVWDVSDQSADLRSGRSVEINLDAEPRQRVTAVASFPGQPKSLFGNGIETKPTRDSYMYFVYFNGAGGTFRELIELVKVKGAWKQAYRLEEVPFNEPMEPVGEYFDEGFPTDGSVFVHASEHGYPRLEAPPLRKPIVRKAG